MLIGQWWSGSYRYLCYVLFRGSLHRV
jgi:hypothetical protein